LAVRLPGLIAGGDDEEPVCVFAFDLDEERRAGTICEAERQRKRKTVRVPNRRLSQCARERQFERYHIREMTYVELF
jgi:hypothetical protein